MYIFIVMYMYNNNRNNNNLIDIIFILFFFNFFSTTKQQLPCLQFYRGVYVALLIFVCVYINLIIINAA